MQYADGGYDTDDKVNVYVLLKPSQYYYDSDNTTNKKYWFKLNGNPVSREVAKQMADKYLQKYNLPISDRKIGYVRRYGRYEDGGDIEFGEDLGDGFSVGNDVYITDSKSMYKGKTGFVSGLAGKDLLVTISENGNERSIVVSKKGVEMIDTPMAKGGELSSKELSANPYIKAIETNKPIFRYINGKAVRITKDDLKKLYSIFFNNHGTLESFADKNEIAIEYAKDIVIAGQYYTEQDNKMAKGGQMAKKPAKFKDKVKAISKSLEGKKVPKRVRKDYGATYDKKESIDAAKRIAGSMVKKERKRYGI
jgi:hypothetical protein